MSQGEKEIDISEVIDMLWMLPSVSAIRHIQIDNYRTTISYKTPTI